MEIKIQISKAKEVIDNHISECRQFLDANNVSLQVAKEMANDWYQNLIQDLTQIFYEPQPLIDDMNDILAKETHTTISSSLRYTAPTVNSHESYKKTESFLNKVINIIKYLEELKTKF